MTIIFIEDDPWLSELYGTALRRINNLQVFTANSADTALDTLNTQKVDLIVLDMFLGAHNGIEFLHEIASYEDTRHTPVVILSAVHEHDFGMTAQRWKQYNVVKYLYKPSTKPELLVAAVTKQLLSMEASNVQ
ncbi:response regulator [Candidatus Saccharibacteria bacterium]|nr:response regulator [Candidatus Saccharibacteria bacterium]